jgi:hypothetical protein
MEILQILFFIACSRAEHQNSGTVHQDILGVGKE